MRMCKACQLSQEQNSLVQTLIALAAEPLASLVDTIWVGRIGPAELAACAAANAVFNLVTKIINMPLTAVTTSMIAHASAPSQGSGRPGSLIRGAVSFQCGDSAMHQDTGDERASTALADAVTGALLLGVTVGCLQGMHYFTSTHATL